MATIAASPKIVPIRDSGYGLENLTGWPISVIAGE
jgi:hypothetical protein